MESTTVGPEKDGTNPEGPERILWEAYPSWGQFSWLYFLSLWTALRGLVFIRVGVPGWEIWVVGAALLLGVAAILRYWAYYVLTSQQVLIRNGYSGKTIRCANLDMIHSIEVMQGPLAKFLGIGTVVIQCHDSNQTLRFRGIKDPEIVETKLRALLPASSPVFTQAL
jgi:membrane protein YdbS with pleckstrin-like domain